MVLRARIALSTESWRLLTRFGFIVGENIVGIVPSGVLRHYLLVVVAFIFFLLHDLQLSDIVHRLAQIVRTVCKGAMGSVFHTVATCVGLVHARRGLVVAQMVATLHVASYTVQIRTILVVQTLSSRLIIVLTVNVRTVSECAVLFLLRPATLLVEEVPRETGEGTVLDALVLLEELALFDTEFFEVGVVERFLCLRLVQLGDAFL